MFDPKGTHELGNASIAASPHRNYYIQFFHAQMLLARINKYTITYINREKNTMADALFQLPDLVDEKQAAIITSVVFEVRSDPKLVTRIMNGYHSDLWCNSILKDLDHGMLDAN